MAFDSCVSTPPVITPDANRALTLYSIARTAGAPAAYEAAAHALAAALQAAVVASRLDRPPEQRRAAHAPEIAAMVAVSGYAPEAAAYEIATRRAKLPRTPKARSAPAGEDLAATLPRPPRNKLASGAFTVTWADGSETFVSAVTWHSGKPATRWAAAFQAADRLRRLRSRAAYAADLEAGADGVARWHADSSGLQRETPAFQELVTCRPLPPLVGISEDVGGETFTPAAGSAFGGGDAERARLLEASICEPRAPWRFNSWQGVEGAIPLPGARGDLYWKRPAALADEMRDRPATHWATGWPPIWREVMRRDAMAAFAVAPADLQTAAPGENLAGLHTVDLDSARVVIDLAAARAKASARFCEDEPAWPAAADKLSWEDREAAKAAHAQWATRRSWHEARREAAIRLDLMACAVPSQGRVYTLRSGTLGRSFTIDNGPGTAGACFDAHALDCLAFAA